MPKTRRPYSRKFRERVLALWRAGKSASELAEEYEPCYQTIKNWIETHERSCSTSATSQLEENEREELERLRRENEQLRMEREILSKAAAWFAHKTDAIAPDSSRS